MDDLSFESQALAAYRAAAAQVSSLLGDAATSTATAAEADLSHLGLIGAEFARTWARVVGGHATTLRTASDLTAAYSTVLDQYGAQVTATDSDTARALGALGEQQ